MTKVFERAAAAVLGCLALQGYAVADSRIQVRGTPEEMVLSVEGKERHYYHLSANQSLETEILGPASIVATFRILFLSTTTNHVRYRIPVTMDNEQTHKHSRDAARSDKVRFLEKSSPWIPGKSNKVSLQVPEGSHMIRWGPLRDLGKKPVEAAVSFLREKQKLPLTPSRYAWVARDHYRGKDRTWYGATARRPVLLEVVGPTRLQVVSSLDFGPGLRGLQGYTLDLEMDGTPAKSWRLRAEKSETWSYKDRAQIVPGNPNRSTINIPKGKHLVRVRLTHALASSVCLRFLIPKQHALNTSGAAEPPSQ